ncbi:MAG TPA: hypothetical protein DIS84_01935 [Corynebacterium stationis]|nr:hypothetical protein [Corynebacterium stationis]
MESRLNEFSSAESYENSPYGEQPSVNPHSRIGNVQREEAKERLHAYARDGYISYEELIDGLVNAETAVTANEIDSLFAGLPAETTQSLNANAARESTLQSEAVLRVHIIETVSSLVWPASVLLWALWDLAFKLPYAWILFVLAGIISIITQIMLWSTNSQDKLATEASSEKKNEIEERVRIEIERKRSERY